MRIEPYRIDIPDEVLDELRGFDAILLGAVGPPIGDTKVPPGTLERGLLPHTNLGVLAREDLARLREVTASQGLMLESVSERLMETVHAGSPTKHPARRLETIREVGSKLLELPQLGRDVFPRGDPEPIAEIKRGQWTASLYDLLAAYAADRQKHALAHVRFAKRTVWSLAEAREAVARLIGGTNDWVRLDDYLISYLVEPSMRPTVIASSLAATLEMVREGLMEVHQNAAFAPIYVRKRGGTSEGTSAPPAANVNK